MESRGERGIAFWKELEMTEEWSVEWFSRELLRISCFVSRMAEIITGGLLVIYLVLLNYFPSLFSFCKKKSHISNKAWMCLAQASLLDMIINKNVVFFTLQFLISYMVMITVTTSWDNYEDRTLSIYRFF